MSFLLPSFPHRRESIFEIQQLFFKSRFLKFYDGFPP
ncbi:pilS cassette [Neisseria mucosa]|uniref:PilS cassette n=1 Tax=Neisseria mucosa TaxID=488 RepID=A0ABM6T421_NEIMU|nr:pilS cassette [Neisseria mucosa]AVR79800.1 pilS cassette [Neisseria mucosa]